MEADASCKQSANSSGVFLSPSLEGLVIALLQCYLSALTLSIPIAPPCEAEIKP